MNYQQYQYSYTPATGSPNHWLDLLLKVGGLLGGVTIAAVMGAHLIHAYSPPSRTSPIAQIVRYYDKGIGHAGESSHWTMEASDGTREWTRAVRYCQAQAQSGEQGQSAAPGCATINTLSESGY